MTGEYGLEAILSLINEKCDNLTIVVIEKTSASSEKRIEGLFEDNKFEVLFASVFNFTEESAKRFFLTDSTPNGVCYIDYIKEKISRLSKVYILRKDEEDGIPCYKQIRRIINTKRLCDVNCASNLSVFYQKANVILHQLLIEKQIDGFTMHDLKA